MPQPENPIEPMVTTLRYANRAENLQNARCLRPLVQGRRGIHPADRPAHSLPGRRASRGTARRRSVRYPGASSPMYLACTSGGPLVYLAGDPGVTVLRAEALARC